jgi:hypothetical protein
MTFIDQLVVSRRAGRGGSSGSLYQFLALTEVGSGLLILQPLSMPRQARLLLIK